MNIYIILGIAVPMMYTFFMAYELFNTVYQTKYSQKVYVWGYVMIFTFQSCVASFRIPILTFVSFALLITLISALGYKSTTRNKVIYTTMCIFYLVLLDAVVVPVVATVAGKTVSAVLASDEKFFITGVVTAIIGLCTFKPVIRILARYKIAVLTKSQEIFIVFLGCFELGSLHSILQLKKYHVTEFSGMSIGISMGFVVLNIYLIILFEAISRANELKVVNSLLEQRMIMEEDHYEELKSQNESYRKIMHDIRKHVGLIRQTPNIDKEYCQQLVELIEHHGFRFACTNAILSVIINDRIMFCENNNIELKYQIEDIDLGFMRKIDITTIFLNLINNAVEACMELEHKDRILEITIKEIQKHIVVVIKNSYNKTEQSFCQVGKSQKKGHMGLGLVNVRTALERYGAALEIDNGKEFFEVKFIVRP